MKRLICYCFVLFAFFNTNLLKAQLDSVSIKNLIVNTSNLGDSTLFEAQYDLYNASSVSTIEIDTNNHLEIEIWCKITNITQPQLSDSFQLDFKSFNAHQSVLPNSVIGTPGYKKQLPPEKLKVGGNTVVIWPKSNRIGFFSSDSIIVQTNARASILKGIEGLAVFPNPVVNQLTITSKDQIRQVNLIDITGKVMGTYNNMKTVPAENLAPGSYLLEIETTSGQKAVVKIVKE